MHASYRSWRLGMRKRGNTTLHIGGRGYRHIFLYEGYTNFRIGQRVRAERPRKECGRQEIQHVESEQIWSEFVLVTAETVDIAPKSVGIYCDRKVVAMKGLVDAATDELPRVIQVRYYCCKKKKKKTRKNAPYPLVLANLCALLALLE
ncbi:hypothetical protein K457DRAFT_735646 [Linnemannia elongata AG-77]|uniref:Uncharacterized protein n=1 Tax=Linnemannia elongata AG-77 TaxID=1314771 RepID=A0A197JP76_9FUNG|nr:hypothetical protein K457DRAFT_735646 [Linnemannia elongata AG-77]